MRELHERPVRVLMRPSEYERLKAWAKGQGYSLSGGLCAIASAYLSGQWPSLYVGAHYIGNKL